MTGAFAAVAAAVALASGGGLRAPDAGLLATWAGVLRVHVEGCAARPVARLVVAIAADARGPASVVAEARRQARAALAAAPCPGKARPAPARTLERWAQRHAARVRADEDFRIGPRTYRAARARDLPFVVADGLGSALGWPRSTDRGTRGQRAAYQLTVLEDEVNNGGFQQYFDNSSGSITEAIAGARLVGATEYARLIAEAGRRHDGDLGKLDDRFFALDRRRGKRLDDYIVRYVRGHRDAFVRPR